MRASCLRGCCERSTEVARAACLLPPHPRTSGVTPKRLADTGLKRETYRAATAMECLVSWLGCMHVCCATWPTVRHLAACCLSGRSERVRRCAGAVDGGGSPAGTGLAAACHAVPPCPLHRSHPSQCGYLYLSDPERLHGMMQLLGLGDAPAAGGGGGGGSVDGSSVDGSSVDGGGEGNYGGDD